MVSSVGKKLQQARISKQLSVEEAARVTRIRPDKLIDLEEDNYANFPSMSYAKGFLLLYARFLGVDVHDFADSLHAPNPVSTEEYEYLNAGASAQPGPPRGRPYYFSPRRERRTTLLPVIVIGLLIGVISLAFYLYVNFLRIGPLDEVGEKSAASPAASPAISTLPPPAVATPIPATPAPIPPALRSSPPALVASATPSAPPQGAASPAGTFDPNREIRRAEPVYPTPATPPGHADASPGHADASPVAGAGAYSAIVPVSTPAPVKQVSIRPLRKTWVTIRKDVADSTPFFEDWLYPGDAPLKLKGRKFWIKVKDPTAIDVTQDGQPLPAGQADIQIE